MPERPPVKAGVDPQYRQAVALEAIADALEGLMPVLVSMANSLLEVAMVMQSGKIVGIKVDPGVPSLREPPTGKEVAPPVPRAAAERKTAGPG